jgi:hypothetical protein
VTIYGPGYYRDLRVHVDRQNPKISRHQEMRKIQNGTLIYAPLQEGFKYPFKFFNYADGKVLAQEGSITWKDLPNLVICPSQTIFSYDKQGCITEVFISVLQDTQDIVHVMKDKLAGSVFTLFSQVVRMNEYTGLYFRSMSPKVLSYNWQYST